MTKSQLIDFVNSLTPSKREFLALYFASEKEKLQLARIKERDEGHNPVVCPHCSSGLVIKHGSFNNKTRYKCKQCLKHFNKATGWELAHTRKPDAFFHYLDTILNSVPIRKAASDLKVTQRTVFLWRKKIRDAFSYLR